MWYASAWKLLKDEEQEGTIRILSGLLQGGQLDLVTIPLTCIPFLVYYLMLLGPLICMFIANLTRLMLLGVSRENDCLLSSGCITPGPL